MRVFMVGEAAAHSDELVSKLDESIRGACEIVTLPREAAHSADFDGQISAEDVLISLRLSRNGAPLPKVRMLHVPGAGLDGIDMVTLDPATIICNVFEHETPIAEFVLASMLEWEIDIAGMRARFLPDNWSDIYRTRQPHGEIWGKTLGILGYGRIGQAIATRARAVGMRVLGCDAMLGGSAEGIFGPDALEQVLEQAHYFTIACPLTPETRNLINATALRRLGTKGVLINVSRAEIVDEGALYNALSAGTIRGASLDVWYRYPTGVSDDVRPADYEFHALPNVHATPHSSAWTKELMQRRYAVIARNIGALIRGEPLQNRVSSTPASSKI